MPDRTDTGRLALHARVAGLGYLVIIATGIFAEVVVRGSLIVSGDAAATAANITASEGLFRSGLAAELVMLTADVVVAFALFVLFEGVSRGLAILAAFFRLAHAAVVGANLLNFYIPLLLLGDATYMGAFEPAQLHALVSVYLDLHAYGYALGLVFFGVHCLALGSLVLRSGFVPRALGVLLTVAGVGYLVDTFGRTLLTDYAAWETLFGIVVFVPAVVAELSFALWLTVKGGSIGRSES